MSSRIEKISSHFRTSELNINITSKLPEPQIKKEIIDGGICILTFSNPKTLNAVTAKMQKQIIKEVEVAGLDPSVKAIILTGEGRGFCSGAARSALSKLSSNAAKNAPRDPMKLVLTPFLKTPKP
eukprot:maker-scaffold_1-snap-gene-14.4-mRNA-1 protein AED:0.20 eAED:0.20 QI:33/1/1/1/0/0.33/3/602/124